MNLGQRYRSGRLVPIFTRLIYLSVCRCVRAIKLSQLVRTGSMRVSRMLVVCSVLMLSLSAWASTPTVTIVVDATTAPRKIMHAHLTIPATPGDLTLYYPKWIPGEHAPDGPVDDLAGLKFSAGGKILKWRRDLLDGFTLHVDVPAGASEVQAELDF